MIRTIELLKTLDKLNYKNTRIHILGEIDSLEKYIFEDVFKSFLNIEKKNNKYIIEGVFTINEILNFKRDFLKILFNGKFIINIVLKKK